MEPQQFADTYIMANASYFPSEKIVLIKDKLSSLPEQRQSTIQSIPLKNPMIVLLLSLLFGGLAIDRFYLGDVGKGILKIISLFLIVGFIWVFLDIYLCYKKAKEMNFNKIMLIS